MEYEKLRLLPATEFFLLSLISDERDGSGDKGDRDKISPKSTSSSDFLDKMVLISYSAARNIVKPTVKIKHINSTIIRDTYSGL